YQAPFNAFFADTSSGSGNSYATIYYDSDDGSNNIGLQLNSLIPPTAPNGGTAGEVPWDGSWYYRQLILHHTEPVPTYYESYFFADITALVVVPEPGTACLLALGVAVLGRSRVSAARTPTRPRGGS